MLPRPFTITTPETSVELGPDRQGVVAFTVFNPTERRIVGRALVHIPQEAEQESSSWYSISGEAERVFPAEGAEHVSVNITVPSTVPEGTYLFRFDMVGVEDVNELHVPGPTVAVKVPEYGGDGKRRCRWCIPVAVAAALLLGVGIAAFLLWPDGDIEVPDVSNLTPDQATALLTNACEPDPCFSVVTDNGLSDSVQHGLVIESNPAGGSRANQGDEITIFVSAIEIPAIRDMSQNNAISTLENACTPSPCFNVLGIPIITVLPIRLTGTEPSAGTLAQHGTEVRVNWTTDIANPAFPEVVIGSDVDDPAPDEDQRTPTPGQ